MAPLAVVKGAIEQWWSDITSLVTLTGTDLQGNPVVGPVRAPVTVSVPATGVTAKSTAGSAAPDQTLQTFSSSGGVSVNTGATVALFTVPAGKTFFMTDIVVMGNAATATQFLVQVKQGTTVIFEGFCKTDTAPVEAPGLETQPSAPSGTAVSLVLGTGASTTATYFISGYVQ